MSRLLNITRSGVSQEVLSSLPREECAAAKLLVVADGKPVRLVAHADERALCDLQGQGADDVRALPLRPLHHSDHGDRAMRLFERRTRGIHLRYAAIDEDEVRQRPVVPEAALEHLLEARRVVRALHRTSS